MISASPAALSFRYLARFRCIGGACEDGCCSHWRIELDEETRARLVALAESPGAAPPMAGLRVLGEAPPEGEVPSEGDPRLRMPQRESGDCVLLDGDRLCALQHHHGESALPVVCAVFPRRLARVHERLELTATVACPEIARLALLSPDAMELVEVPPPPRTGAVPSLERDGEQPYRRHFPLVRGAVLQLLAADGHPIDARLFFIAYLAASIHPYYRADSPADGRAERKPDGYTDGQAHGPQGAGGAGDFPIESLHHQIGVVQNPEAQAHLAARLAEAPFDPSVGKVVLETVALLCITASERLAPLLESAIEACQDEDGERTLQPRQRALRVSVARIAAVQQERRRGLVPELASRLDAAITRYFINLTMHSWFLDTGDLFLHHQALLIRLALLRFLVLGQPGAGSDPAALDAAIVAVFSTVTRAFDHDAALTAALHDAIKAMGPSSPMHAARLLRF